MKHRLIALAATVCAAALAAPVALAYGPAASDAVAPHYYVALGDSLAEGYQLNGDAGHGYADQIYAALKSDDPTLQLENLSCGGETTSTMINGGLPYEGRGAAYHCNYPTGSQLAEAVAFLLAHRQFVSFVTIDVGADDLGPCLAVLDFSDSCLNTYLPGVTQNLAAILAQLHAAAGPNVPVVGMNYYDPFLGLWVFGDEPDAIASESFTVQLNEALEDAYQAAGDPVANVEDAFAATDFSNSATLPGFGTVPLNVYDACTLTWFCAVGDIHANTAGYGVIAQAFEDVLP